MQTVNAEPISELSSRIKNFHNAIASQREVWIRKNQYYHDDISAFVASNILPSDHILHIGCGIGNLLGSLDSQSATGLDISEEMIRIARQKYSHVEWKIGRAEDLPKGKTYDKVILSDTIGFFSDVQKAFTELRHVTTIDSRIIITYYNYLWEPLLKLAELAGLKMPEPMANWLPLKDIQNLLYLSGFEVVKKGHRLLVPLKIPFLSTFLNRFIAKLPGIRNLCLVQWLIAKPIGSLPQAEKFNCSVVIPCRNERGNIEDAVLRTPFMGSATELIFVDGNSTDGTVEEIQRLQQQYPDRSIRLIHQGEAKGKNDALRKGFDGATGDVFMILDADLTVPPEDLPKFFQALGEGKGDLIIGTRLVYPMEKEAMRFLNLLGNKFFGLAFSYLLDARFTDTLCGTKVLLRKSYEKIKEGRSYFGDFDPFGDFDLIFGASRQNLKIIELPIRYKDRAYGITKIRRFAHGWLLLKMCWVAMKKLKFA
ncbi:MAG: glycosyltransferase [Candidatus Omnitrophica bacterium]|nr:glycosyltransferase [Candidatus Omnitrophota bacterium]